MNGTFLVTGSHRRRASPGSTVRPVCASRVARLLKKEMSHVFENQGRASGVKTLTTQAIDVSRARLDLRQKGVS
jgi:hypothetical protein